MRYIKDRPIWIWLFAIVIIFFDLYYYYPLYTGTGAWKHIDSILTFSEWSIFVWLNIILTIIELFSVTIGFYKRLNWARLYEIGYLSYSAFWANVSIYLMRWQIYEHYGYFVLYIILICWLLMSPAKEYFVKVPSGAKSSGKMIPYKYGNYILYSKIVKLKSGKLQVIYFFAKKKPRSGTQVYLPIGYKLYINKISGMPYLKKKR